LIKKIRKRAGKSNPENGELGKSKRMKRRILRIRYYSKKRER
jgi:hypothetical protein